MTTQPSDEGARPAAPTKPGVGRRRPRVIVWLLLLVVVFLPVFVLIEVVLWIFHPLPMSEAMEYRVDGHTRVRPIAGQAIANRAGYKVRINRDGFRGRDYAYEKPKGTLRLIVFGGSAAFDFEASSEEKSWPGALQLKLADKLHMPVEVINLAVPGYDAFNNKISYLYVGRNFQPDAVLLYETWNDMGRYRELEKGPYECGPSTPNKALWEKLARMTQLGRHALPIIRAIQGRKLDDITKVGGDKAGDLSRPADEKALAWDRRNFSDFINFAKGDGVLPIVASMGFLGSEQNLKDEKIRQTIAAGCVQRGFTPESATQTLVKMSGIIRDLAAEKGAVFVDGYAAVPHDLEHIRDNVHLYDAGSEKLAQAIVDTLIADKRFTALADRVRQN